MIETVDFIVENDVPAILTWYADPAHVIRQKPFYKALEHAAAAGVISHLGSDLATMLRESI